MTRKRLLWLLGLGLSFATILLWRSPEGRLESELAHAATQLSYARDESPDARAARFRETCTKWLDDSSRISLDGAGVYTGHDATLRALTDLAAARPRAYFEIERVEVRIEGDARASAVGLINVSDSQVGDLHRDQRRLDISLFKTASGWKIQMLRVGEADNTQPWERP
ncbi:MAG: hypothetical protein KC766_35260 [Myxococcales bacterium]|nr:hypothetical protein [Myxococcales bacterium]